jgi:SM-20-related protein
MTEILPSPILRSEFCQIDDWLTAPDHQQLLDYVRQPELAFVPTSTATNEQDYRRSQVLYEFPEFAGLIRDRIQASLPEVYRQLVMADLPIADIEMQLTAHNDGNYYKVHNDNGSPDTATREFTYVYYFYCEPQAFTGGELIIYDSQVANGFYVQADSYHTVIPRNNSIVFFLSRYLHEVLPVHCPSHAFSDSRFTINGWLRR